MFSIAKSACLRYIMRKNLKNFPGAAPPDPCRSSLGTLARTSLALRYRNLAALRATLRKMQIYFGWMQKKQIYSHVLKGN